MAREYAEKANLMFFETSSKTGSEVKTLFNELAKKLTGVEVNLIETKNDPGNGGF